MTKASETAKLVKKLSAKLTTVEAKVSDTTIGINSSQSETISVNNVVKIETLNRELEQVKTRLAQFEDKLGSNTLDLNSPNTGAWYKNKFEALLQAPESRRYIKDTIDTKLATFQVSYRSNFIPLQSKNSL